jgi:hypothetical protein
MSHLLNEVAVLEAAIGGANALVGSAQAELRMAKKSLEVFELRVNVLRGRRRAAIESMRLTERVARRCGLANSLSTRSSIAQYASQAHSALMEIREIISSASDACTALSVAHDNLRSARAKQASALRALADALARAQEVNRRAPSRRTEIAKQLEQTSDLRLREEADARTELLWMEDAHYDPRYDAREVAVRRSRPWV